MKNRVLKILLEFLSRSKETRHRKVHQGVVLQEVILDRSTRKKHPPLDIDRVERSIRQILAVLEPMRFVA